MTETKTKKTKLIRYLRPYWFFAVISPLLMIGEVMGDLFLPKLMSYIVDYGIVDGGLDEMAKNGFASGVMSLLWGESYTQMQTVITFGVMMLCVVLVGGFFGTFCAYTAARASNGFGNDLRCDVYRRVMSLSVEQTDRFTTGSLVTRVTNDIAMNVDFVEMMLRHVVRAPVFLIGGTLMLLTLHIRFGVVLLLSLPVLLAALSVILVRAVPMYAKVQTKLDKVNSVVQENVSGARVVKACVREDYENDRFGQANRELFDLNLKVLKLMAVIMPILNIVQNFATIAILYIGGVGIEEGIAGMSVGTVMAAVNYVTRVITSVMMVTMVFQSVSRAAASSARIREVLDTEPVIRSGNQTAEPGEIAVEFRHVGFRYPGTSGNPVLSDINLAVRRGETLAIVGATGAGKSTLTNLIPRFYDATEGEVLVDGLNVKEYDTASLRGKIGYVLQKSELFSGTVASNIRWGKENASDEEIAQALSVAAADFVAESPDGIGLAVTEKGTSLSGGQKQRLSIARAVARHPEILILDDATSALDLATEARLRSSLRKEMDGCTVILIAQRIASVKNADRIAVIENGRIAACASHEDLLATSAVYRDIVESQNRNGGADHA